MNIFKSVASLLALTVLSAGIANAEDSNFGIGVKAGTLGLGAEIRWAPVPIVDFRVGANAYDLGSNGQYAGIDYDATLELESYFLTANINFPLSPFRITAGLFSNSNQMVMVGSEAASYNIGGTTFSPGEVGTLTSTTTFDDVATYVGIGIDFELFDKAGINFDLGVLLQGDPVVTLESNMESVNALLRDAVVIETAGLTDKMDYLKAYPVISLSVVYNF